MMSFNATRNSCLPSGMLSESLMTRKMTLLQLLRTISRQRTM